MIKRALLSVSDKRGIVELAKALKHFQVEIISTGGTAKMLEEANVRTTQVSDYTGFPEMMDGRVKTLHPRIHGALLGRRDHPADQESAAQYGIKWIDLVVVNLYPFQKVADASFKPQYEELIENIDIGGPSMIRAAAKNHRHVTVVVDPDDYTQVIQKLKDNPQEPFDLISRYHFATKAFAHTGLYDSVIAQTLSHYDLEGEVLQRKSFPRYHFVAGKITQELRYGENPHQRGAVYRSLHPAEDFPMSRSLQGKEMSYNNYLDVHAVWKLAKELPPQSTVIVKHNNPCGVGLGSTLSESFDLALQADPESAFGGVVALSGEVDGELAQKMTNTFFEIICANSFSVEAREILKEKKNLRLILLSKDNKSSSGPRTPTEFRKTEGGYLLQDTDALSAFNSSELPPDVQYVTTRKPTPEEASAMQLAWVVVANVKSNGVVITNQHVTLGIGCGMVNRRFASEHAANQSLKFDSKLRVCASDAFFPFADNIEVLQKAGVTAIIQPGGSIRDQDVIAACNKANMAMVFTKVRHFRH